MRSYPAQIFLVCRTFYGIFCFFVMLGIEPTVSCTLRKWSVTAQCTDGKFNFNCVQFSAQFSIWLMLFVSYFGVLFLYQPCRDLCFFIFWLSTCNVVSWLFWCPYLVIIKNLIKGKHFSQFYLYISVLFSSKFWNRPCHRTLYVLLLLSRLVS